MENAPVKNSNLRHYWHIFLPLAFILTLMLRFPLRIFMGGSIYDAILYGTIAFMCFVVGIWVYARFRKPAIPLIMIILWCAVVCVWQVLDVLVLRSPFVHAYFYIIPQTIPS
jgi:hypothetical protein